MGTVNGVGTRRHHPFEMVPAEQKGHVLRLHLRHAEPRGIPVVPVRGCIGDGFRLAMGIHRSGRGRGSRRRHHRRVHARQSGKQGTAAGGSNQQGKIRPGKKEKHKTGTKTGAAYVGNMDNRRVLGLSLYLQVRNQRMGGAVPAESQGLSAGNGHTAHCRVFASRRGGHRIFRMDFRHFVQRQEDGSGSALRLGRYRRAGTVPIR